MTKAYKFQLIRIWAIIVMGLAVSTGQSRTIVLDAGRADRMAAIHQLAPRLSWAAHNPRAGIFDTQHIDLTPESQFLIRFDLSMIPLGQRITHAELSVPVTEFTGVDSRLMLWRTVAAWGLGVCHDFRLTRPKPEAWAVSGARGAGADRALQPTALLRVTQRGAQTMNVTEDIALWYLKAAPDQGWILGVEDAGTRIRLSSPIWNAKEQWTLRITYEPE